MSERVHDEQNSTLCKLSNHIILSWLKQMRSSVLGMLLMNEFHLRWDSKEDEPPFVSSFVSCLLLLEV